MKSEQGIYVSMDELVELQARSRSLSESFSRLTKSMLQGNRPARMNGKGGAFDQIRSYIIGDDVRDIDWNVTARTGKPFVRVFKEERERALVVLVDQSSDMFFATKKQLKSVVAAKTAATLLWMADSKKRPSGAIVLGDDDISVMRPRAAKHHLLQLLAQLEQYNNKLSPKNHSRKADITFTNALHQLHKILPRDALVVIISDFHQADEEGWSLIERLSYRTSLIAMPVYDGLVEGLPTEGNFLATYSGLQSELDFSSYFSRDTITKKTKGRLDEICRTLTEYGASVLPLSTYLDVEAQLVKGLAIGGATNE